MFESFAGEAIGIVKGNKRSPKPWVIVTRFCLPNETVRVRLYWNKRLHSFADVIEVVTPNLELRDNSRIKCKYFAECGGCQYQMLSYDHQLKLKRDVIVKAYKSFSNLPDSSVPIIQNAIPSPFQYGYRTKLTPHFDAPPKEHRKKKASVVDEKVVKPEWLKIGFNKAGTHRVMDIEECPISTPTLNNALPSVRENIYRNIHRYEKGVSLTLRDSLIIPNAGPSTSSTSLEAMPPSDPPVPPPSTATTSPDTEDSTDDALSTMLSQHVCITDPKATVRESVGDFIFEYHASSFFQNNNSVLRPLTEYVRDAIFPPSLSPSTATSSPQPMPTHLVDAYCGAGLFSITLSPYFEKIAGIELSSESIKAAQHNASLNSIPSSKITFRAGDAGDLFATVRQDFPPSQTVLIIDPPRKGCDDNFIQQALDFRCGTIVYVSCNVHTQARDVGKLVDGTKEDGVGRRYVIESLRGFDLFPQTAHIEGVAVLRLV
ncbi:hypothetical protein M378DRAFT_82761 [Amanita muscaria Koide BX008]|uniref:TRAM domain-containing protein n=1 Tax=Amanita muscaria (strain Koide BX008) TaxID=946122 RepID=A0A0C2WWK9_AMAMK|nr:hypothetical protein M378DRAFT_82761 [Amanita muscaria Koide BX008]